MAQNFSSLQAEDSLDDSIDNIADSFSSFLGSNSGTSEPTYKVAGTLWYDTTGPALKVYNGSTWEAVPLSAGSATIASSNYTALPTDSVLYGIATGGSFTITLPAVADAGELKAYYIVKADGTANTITIDGDGSEQINYLSSITLAYANQAVLILAMDSRWFIFGNNGFSIGNYNVGAGNLIQAGGSGSNTFGDPVTFTTGQNNLLLKPSSTQSITAVGNTISANAGLVVLDPNGNYTLTSTPTIANGTTGQVCIITAGNSEANSVTLQDETALASSNLNLQASTRTIVGQAILALMYDGTNWIELFYSRNDGLNYCTNLAVTGTGYIENVTATNINQNGTGGRVLMLTPVFVEAVLAQITSNTHNYSLDSSLGNACFFVVSSDGNYDITGIVAPASDDQKESTIWLCNLGSNTLTLKHESASSTAANRIKGWAGADCTLGPGITRQLYYSFAYSRWIVITN